MERSNHHPSYRSLKEGNDLTYIIPKLSRMLNGQLLPVVLLTALVFAAVYPARAITYYSRASGNWTTASTWSTVGCGGAAAATTPTSADDVVICAGHTVTTNFGANTTILNLTVNATGVLTMSNTRQLLCRSVVLNGTINGASSGQVRMAGVAGSTLSGTGTVACTGGSCGIRIRNNTTVSAGSDITFSNSSRLELVQRTLTNNGTIRIAGTAIFTANATGTANFVNATASSFLYYTSTSALPTTMRLTATAVGNTVVFGNPSGSLLLDAQGSYHHLIIQGGGTKRLNPATINIAGQLTIENGATLDANGGKTISIQGDWDNDNGGSFTESTSVVVFSSSTGNQTIYPPAGANGETFNSLTISNTFAGGTVTANGNITITSGATLTMTAGIFNTGVNTLSQPSGAANFTATGGELRVGKTAVTLPELSGTYNITGGTITFNGAGAQTIRALATAPAQYNNVILGGSGTKTLAGNVWVNGNWTNNGVTLAGNFTTTFGGVNNQTITRTGTEAFFRLTVNKPNLLILASGTDVTISDGMTMTTGDINLNGQTLTLGLGSGATLSRTAGKAYGGTWRRFFPSATAITSNSGSFLGLFPIGTAIEYRPVEINTTVNATTGGYVLASHTDGTTTSDVNFVDNEGATVQRITNMRSTLSTQTLAGGTYSIDVKFTSLSTAGSTGDLKLETLAGSPQGVGISAPTLGPVEAPTGRRTNLAVAQLNNDFVLGSTNKTTTPMKSTFYSRRTGAWNDATVGNGTWSATDGGVSCDCVPPSSSDVIINSGHTVSISTPSTADFIIVRAGGILNGTNNLVVNFDLSVEGNGQVSPTGGSWSIGRNFNLTGTTTSAGGAALTIGGDLVVSASNSLTLTAPLTVTGNVTLNGNLDIGSSSLTLNGASRNITGSSTVNGSGTITITGNKSTAVATNLTFNPTITLSAATTFTNNGTITVAGTVNGVNATTSVWTNASGSVLNIGASSFLATGTLNASATINTVSYNSTGNQAIKVATGGYFNLNATNSGTKTLSGATSVSNLVTVSGTAILDAGTNALSGTAGLTMTGTSEFQSGNTATGTYPALTGTYLLTGGTVVLKQTPGGNTNYTIRGVGYNNLTLSGGGNANYAFGSGALVNNNFTVTFGGTSTFTNPNGDLVISNIFNFSPTSSATSTLGGGLIVGGFLQGSGALVGAGNIIEVTGPSGWVRNGGTYTNSGAGEVYFTGTQEQPIGGSVSTTFHRLDIENSSATGVRLNRQTTVSTELILTNGNVITTGTNYLELSSGATSGAGSSESFVEGPMRRTGTTAFVFPVGKNGVWARIGIGALSTSLTFQAEYFNNGYGNYDISTAVPQGIEHVSSLEYWQLDRISASGSASVSLYWENADISGIRDCNDLVVAKGNGSSKWENANVSTFSGSCGPGASGFITSQPLSSFSPFTFGSTNGENPLPIKLLNFSATAANKEIGIVWTTAQEINNDKFTLERSRDGVSYEVIYERPGAGNSDDILSYTFEDRKPYPGVNYYRLLQTDYDGKYEYFGPVSASMDSRKTLEVYPNPASDIVRWQSPEQVFIVKLYDNSGRLHTTSQLQNGEAEISIASLQTGIYHLQLITPTSIYNSKVIKE